jgi:hypothetical protein
MKMMKALSFLFLLTQVVSTRAQFLRESTAMKRRETINLDDEFILDFQPKCCLDNTCENYEEDCLFPWENPRTPTDFRCEHRCANNPGFNEGYFMSKWFEKRNGRICVEYCVHTHRCANVGGYPWYIKWMTFINFCGVPNYANLEEKAKQGWTCGRCPGSN